MNEKLKKRLNQIAPRLESQEFLENSGLGNEIGFYIFDYPPEDELDVRNQVQIVLDQLVKKRPDLRVAHVNLFKLIVDYLKDRGLLDRALKMQREKGDEALRKALRAPLHEEKVAKAFVAAANPDEHDMVIITGVGNAWPILRSHTLLNNLHPYMKDTPLVIFYPGVYDGQSLRLFGRMKDSHYYRAFQLVV